MAIKKDGKVGRKRGRKKKLEKRVIRPRRNDKTNELYCVCRQAWDGNCLMVQCDHCSDWFHPKCVGVSSKEAKEKAFVCPSCSNIEILQLSDYRMNSFSKKMQLSYYETIDPDRLYQMYSIPQLLSSSSASTNFINDIEQILSTNDLVQIQQNVLNRMQQNDSNDTLHYIEYYEEIKSFVTKKKNKIEFDHKKTNLECFDFVFCAIFSKQLDLLHHISESKPFKTSKIISDEQVKEFVIKKISTNIISKYDAMTSIGSNQQSINLLINSSDEYDQENDSAADNGQLLNNNLDSYSTIAIDTSMCRNCDGQIPTNEYMQHLEQCLASKHAHYEQRNDVKRALLLNKDDDIVGMQCDDLLFSTPYKSVCHPPNPLEAKIDEQSESDIETVSCLCPPDINDRQKVIAQLIKTKKKYEFDHRTFSLHHQHCDDYKKQQPKELEMWHKVYTRLIDQNDDYLSSSPSSIGYEENMQNILKMNANQRRRQNVHMMQNLEDSEDEEDEEEEDDDEDEDEDDDDDIPIAQNIKKQQSMNEQNEINVRTPSNEMSEDNELTKKEKYKQEYDKMHSKFKEYYRRKRMKKMKKRQKKMNKEKNEILDEFDEHCAEIESDKAVIERLHKILIKETNINDRFAPFCSLSSSSMKASKQLLKDMMECVDIKTQFCGFLFDKPKEMNEHKSMRMDVDDGNNEEEIIEKYEYFCHERLDKNGHCPVHQNWRKEKYEELVSNLKTEMESLFVLNCVLKQTNNVILEERQRQESMQKEKEFAFDAVLNNENVKLLEGLNDSNPCCSIKINSSETDIDLLLESIE